MNDHPKPPPTPAEIVSAFAAAAPTPAVRRTVAACSDMLRFVGDLLFPIHVASIALRSFATEIATIKAALEPELARRDARSTTDSDPFARRSRH